MSSNSKRHLEDCSKKLSTRSISDASRSVLPSTAPRSHPGVNVTNATGFVNSISYGNVAKFLFGTISPIKLRDWKWAPLLCSRSARKLSSLVFRVNIKKNYLGLVIMRMWKLTRTHKVGNSCRYLSLIDCRRGFAHPPRSVQYYGKFPTTTLISGLPVCFLLPKYYYSIHLSRRDLHKYKNLNSIGETVPNRNVGVALLIELGAWY